MDPGRERQRKENRGARGSDSESREGGMDTYRLSKDDRDTMREKIRVAQTLLNAHLVAELEGRRPPSTAVRLSLAADAEELVHDVADMLDRLTVDGATA